MKKIKILGASNQSVIGAYACPGKCLNDTLKKSKKELPKARKFE